MRDTATKKIQSHPRLGRVPDTVVAAEVGCSAPLVCMVRQQLGVAPCVDPGRPRRPEAAAAYALRDVLGMPWAEVALRLGYDSPAAAMQAAKRYQRAAGRPKLRRRG